MWCDWQTHKMNKDIRSSLWRNMLIPVGSGAASGSISTTDVSHHAPALRGEGSSANVQRFPRKKTENVTQSNMWGKDLTAFSLYGSFKANRFVLRLNWFVSSHKTLIRGSCVMISQCPWQCRRWQAWKVSPWRNFSEIFQERGDALTDGVCVL